MRRRASSGLSQTNARRVDSSSVGRLSASDACGPTRHVYPSPTEATAGRQCVAAAGAVTMPASDKGRSAAGPLHRIVSCSEGHGRREAGRARAARAGHEEGDGTPERGRCGCLVVRPTGRDLEPPVSRGPSGTVDSAASLSRPAGRACWCATWPTTRAAASVILVHGALFIGKQAIPRYVLGRESEAAAMARRDEDGCATFAPLRRMHRVRRAGEWRVTFPRLPPRPGVRRGSVVRRRIVEAFTARGSATPPFWRDPRASTQRPPDGSEADGCGGALSERGGDAGTGRGSTACFTWARRRSRRTDPADRRRRASPVVCLAIRVPTADVVSALHRRHAIALARLPEAELIDRSMSGSSQCVESSRPTRVATWFWRSHISCHGLRGLRTPGRSPDDDVSRGNIGSSAEGCKVSSAPESH
jgi:hypothetical protein